MDTICPNKTPKVIPRGHMTPMEPLSAVGASSVKYIGITQVINPRRKEKYNCT